ncbi:MAG: arginine deiminase-related protein [Bdellovibrionota bacterium]
MAILDTPDLLRQWTIANPLSVKTIPQRNKILMLHPQHYKISYAINPHMRLPDGKLKQVDSSKATEQWKKLVKSLENCGLEVEIMDSQAKFPDMVFAANQSFVYWNLNTNRPEVLLSNMKHSERQGEIPYFEEYFNAHDYKIHKIPQELSFEGTGDASIDIERKVIFAGYGMRSHPSTPSRLCELTGYPVVPLELKNTDYYHLDTCFAPLGPRDVVIADDAFSDEGLDLIYAAFENVIHADHIEAKESLAANLFCPNGKDVIIEEQNTRLIQRLSGLGYNVHPVDTSEFIKSGGSVFCLKLFLW